MNSLVNAEEFHKILASYTLSPQAMGTLKQTKLVLLLGATASGRNTIIQQLRRTGEYHYIVSDTTRRPRLNNGQLEQDGREYWFRAESEVLTDLREGNFLEAEVIHEQQVSGISIRELQAANASNKIAITDVDIGGINNIMRLKPDTIAIMIVPPGFDEWQHRIVNRGEMPAIEYKRRLETAAAIFENSLSHKDFAMVINENVEQAAIAVHHIATMNKVDEPSQEAARALAERLLIQTRLLLETL